MKTLSFTEYLKNNNDRILNFKMEGLTYGTVDIDITEEAVRRYLDLKSTPTAHDFAEYVARKLWNNYYFHYEPVQTDAEDAKNFNDGINYILVTLKKNNRMPAWVA